MGFAYRHPLMITRPLESVDTAVAVRKGQTVLYAGAIVSTSVEQPLYLSGDCARARLNENAEYS